MIAYTNTGEAWDVDIVIKLFVLWGSCEQLTLQSEIWNM